MSFKTLLPLLLLALPLTGQRTWPQVDSPYDLRGLTKEPGPHEPRFTLDPAMAYPATPSLRANPAAPRMIAEWEKVQGALIRYPLGISIDAVKAIASELKVYVLCSASSQTSARNAFQNGGVNMANIAFITATTDTYWTRDYAPWWITHEESGQRVVRPVDVVYRPNGERPNDDRVPQVVASYFQLPGTFTLSFVCQGGNVMTDSLKVGASTDRLRDENPGLTETLLKSMASVTVGFNPYYIATDPAYPADYIKHIDCWAKFISPTKVMVKRVPASDSYYSNYEAAADLWRTRTNAAGQAYAVFRVDGPSAAPYVNHVILNDRVFVPILKSETDPTDKAALDQIRAAYGSSYRVVGVKAAPGLPWLGTDSIHCRVNSIPVFTGLADQTDVPSAPVLTSQPQSQTVVEGQAATFSVTASGTAPLQYQWYRNGSLLSGATGSSHTTPTITSADHGTTFHVVVRNTQGSTTSQTATLTVQANTGVNLALNKFATASGQYSSAYAASKAVDGSTGSAWAVRAGTTSQWLAVDLGGEQSVGKATVQWSQSNYPRSLSVQYQSGSSWVTAYSTTSNGGGTRTYTFTPRTGRNWRLLASTPNSTYVMVYELQLFH